MHVQSAQGCLMGVVVGDMLGSYAELESKENKKSDCKFCQPTDATEMALALARLLAKDGSYNQEKAYNEYCEWFYSKPFASSRSVLYGLSGYYDQNNQDNGALKRISSIGIFGANYSDNCICEWAMKDTEITSQNIQCMEINALFCLGIGFSIRKHCSKRELYEYIRCVAKDRYFSREVQNLIEQSRYTPPVDYTTNPDIVYISFQNALWQLLNARTFEDGIIDTIMHGGDMNANASICGALLGSLYGIYSIPRKWIEYVINCKPSYKNKKVKYPRPEKYWPCDVMLLAKDLIL